MISISSAATKKTRAVVSNTTPTVKAIQAF
jgi:hypothetical protein